MFYLAWRYPSLCLRFISSHSFPNLWVYLLHCTVAYVALREITWIRSGYLVVINRDKTLTLVSIHLATYSVPKHDWEKVCRWAHFIFFFFFQFYLFIFLLYNIVLVLPYIDMNQPWVYMYSPSPSHLPPHSIPLGHPSAPALSTLSHASKLDWWFVSHMIIYMFQCHSPISSCPRPLPQSPKDCSIHLCLFCCLTYRVIITIFLNSIYMR